MFSASIAHRASTRVAVLLAVTLAACGSEAGPSDGLTSESGASLRVVTDLVALYEFSEGSGDTVFDTSGVAPALNLAVQDPSAITWTAGGLSIDSATTPSPSPVTSTCPPRRRASSIGTR